MILTPGLLQLKEIYITFLYKTHKNFSTLLCSLQAALFYLQIFFLIKKLPKCHKKWLIGRVCYAKFPRSPNIKKIKFFKNSRFSKSQIFKKNQILIKSLDYCIVMKISRQVGFALQILQNSQLNKILNFRKLKNYQKLKKKKNSKFSKISNFSKKILF